MFIQRKTLRIGPKSTAITLLLLSAWPCLLQAMEHTPSCHSGHHINMWSEPMHHEAIGVKSGADKRGAQLVKTVCANCHGMNGISRDETVPNLAAQEFWYVCESLHAYRMQTRHDETMNGIAKPLSDQEILDVSDYFAHLPAFNPSGSNQ